MCPRRPPRRANVDAITVLGHELETALSRRARCDRRRHRCRRGQHRPHRPARSLPGAHVRVWVTGADPTALRGSFGEGTAMHHLDIAIQPEGIGRRAKRLVVLDVDSTLIQDEVIELLAAEAGCLDRVRALTEEAMTGRRWTSSPPSAGTLRAARGTGPGGDRSGRAAMRLTPSGPSCAPSNDWATRWASCQGASPASPTASPQSCRSTTPWPTRP